MVSEIKLYKLLAKRFEEAEAESIVAEIEKTVDQRFDSQKTQLATKSDLIELKSSISKDISDLKVDLTKSMFISGLVQFLALLGSLLVIVKFIN